MGNAFVVSISQSRCLSFQESPTRYARSLTIVPFQSRNRDAYHFRPVIADAPDPPHAQFQSRNRDAYHFRDFRCEVRNAENERFNLAIEMLIISGQFSVWMAEIALYCFNLAIEMLIISGKPENEVKTC